MTTSTGTKLLPVLIDTTLYGFNGKHTEFVENIQQFFFLDGVPKQYP
jgi:hypothetical protein